MFLVENGAGERIRTVDSHLGKVVLYQLSYARICFRGKKWSGRTDSNRRQPPWQGGALPAELRPHLVENVYKI